MGEAIGQICFPSFEAFECLKFRSCARAAVVIDHKNVQIACSRVVNKAGGAYNLPHPTGRTHYKALVGPLPATSRIEIGIEVPVRADDECLLPQNASPVDKADLCNAATQGY